MDYFLKHFTLAETLYFSLMAPIGLLIFIIDLLTGVPLPDAAEYGILGGIIPPLGLIFLVAYLSNLYHSFLVVLKVSFWLLAITGIGFVIFISISAIYKLFN